MSKLTENESSFLLGSENGTAVLILNWGGSEHIGSISIIEDGKPHKTEVIENAEAVNTFISQVQGLTGFLEEEKNKTINYLVKMKTEAEISALPFSSVVRDRDVNGTEQITCTTQNGTIINISKLIDTEGLGSFRLIPPQGKIYLKRLKNISVIDKYIAEVTSYTNVTEEDKSELIKFLEEVKEL